MSQGIVRRADKQMSQAEMEEFLGQAAYGHFGTVSANGDPYVVPNLFVYQAGRVYTHNASVAGHFRQNVEHYPRLCFEASAMGQVWPYKTTGSTLNIAGSFLLSELNPAG